MCGWRIFLRWLAKKVLITTIVPRALESKLILFKRDDHRRVWIFPPVKTYFLVRHSYTHVTTATCGIQLDICKWYIYVHREHNTCDLWDFFYFSEALLRPATIDLLPTQFSASDDKTISFRFSSPHAFFVGWLLLSSKEIWREEKMN